MSETRPHILIVDDEACIREPLAVYLRKKGFSPIEAESAGDARVKLVQHPIDLLLLDIMMPGEDGISLYRQLRDAGELPVILLTACSQSDDALAGLGLGDGDYLAKPFDPVELVERIHVALRGPGQRSVRLNRKGVVEFTFGLAVQPSRENFSESGQDFCSSLENAVYASDGFCDSAAPGSLWA